MQVRTDARHQSRRDGTAVDHTVHIEHGVVRELWLIALVVALGVLAAAAIVLPALVTG